MDLLHPAACCIPYSGSCSCSCCCCVKVATCFDYNSWHNKTKLAVCVAGGEEGVVGLRPTAMRMLSNNCNDNRSSGMQHAAGSRQLPFLSGKEREAGRGRNCGRGSRVEAIEICWLIDVEYCCFVCDICCKWLQATSQSPQLKLLKQLA